MQSSTSSRGGCHTALHPVQTALHPVQTALHPVLTRVVSVLLSRERGGEMVHHRAQPADRAPLTNLRSDQHQLPTRRGVDEGLCTEGSRGQAVRGGEGGREVGRAGMV